jgi:hypothetical protein
MAVIRVLRPMKVSKSLIQPIKSAAQISSNQTFNLYHFYQISSVAETIGRKVGSRCVGRHRRPGC